MKVQRLIRLTHLTSEPLDMVDAKLDDYVNNNTTGIIMPLPTSFLKEGDSISKMGTATTSCIQLSFVSSEFVVQNISFSGYWDNRFNEFNRERTSPEVSANAWLWRELCSMTAPFIFLMRPLPILMWTVKTTSCRKYGIWRRSKRLS